jgi:hypothetical protein
MNSQFKLEATKFFQNNNRKTKTYHQNKKAEKLTC